MAEPPGDAGSEARVAVQLARGHHAAEIASGGSIVSTDLGGYDSLGVSAEAQAAARLRPPPSDARFPNCVGPQSGTRSCHC